VLRLLTTSPFPLLPWCLADMLWQLCKGCFLRSLVSDLSPFLEILGHLLLLPASLTLLAWRKIRMLKGKQAPYKPSHIKGGVKGILQSIISRPSTAPATFASPDHRWEMQNAVGEAHLSALCTNF